MDGISFKTVYVAGKNQCAIEALNFLINKKKNFNLVTLLNKSDKGIDNWQKSFKKYSITNKIKIVKVEELYKINNLYLFSFEHEHLLKNELFLGISNSSNKSAIA